MKYTYREIAKILNKIADILLIKGDSPYKIKAYRKAASSILKTTDSESVIVDHEEWTRIRHIGVHISQVIKNVIQKGEESVLNDFKTKNKSVTELKYIKGLGPKRINLLTNELGIHDREELITAINQGKLDGIPMFGKKLQKILLHNLIEFKIPEKFFKIDLASFIIDSFIEHLYSVSYNKKIVCTSNYRRKKELVGSVDILIISVFPNESINAISSFYEIEYVVEKKANYIHLLLRSGLQVILHFVNKNSLGSSMIYFTGSETHLVCLKKIAEQKKLILREMGLFLENKKINSNNEKQIYKALGLNYIEPELRENRGEIEASEKDKLPKLINLNDIKGDLHSHTHETDGINSLVEMAQAAQKHGYQYFAVTDHTKNLKITNGLNEKRLLHQIKLIDKLNAQNSNFIILKGSEVDILEDGSLDLPDWILAELDVRVCSLHSKFHLSEKKQTERILRAMDNPYFNILGHPTGRLIQYRQPYLINIEKIFLAAKERDCVMELNSQPSRLDLNDTYCLLAKEMGVKVAISSDAHSIKGLDFMKFGIYQARRGWLEVSDVINTFKLSDLKKILKK